MEGENSQNSQMISLSKASQLTGYSQGYLNFLIRSGKLKGVKIGRNWVTNKEWLDQCLNHSLEPASEPNQDNKTDNQTGVFSKIKPNRLMVSFLIMALVFLLVVFVRFNLGPDNLGGAGASGFFSRAFDKVRDKLGDKYIEAINFFIPAYTLEIDNQPLIIRTPSRILINENKEVVVISQTGETTGGAVGASGGQQEKVVQITKITETIQPADLSELNQDIESLSNRFTTLSSQISSKIDYTVPSYAPVYVPSSGIQVAGNSILSTLNVSGGASIGDSLSVNKNAQFGNPLTDTDTMNVYSDSTFHNQAVFSGGLSASGGLGAATTTITGNFTIKDSDSNTRLYIDNATGNVGVNSTTPYGLLSVHSDSADDTPLFVVASTTPGVVATTTAFIIGKNGNVGIGTGSPTAQMDVSSATAIIANSAKGINNLLTANPTATSSASYYGVMSIADYQANYGTNSTYYVMGDWSEGRNSGTATLENVVGGWFRAANTSSGTVNDAYGAVGQARNSGTGTMVRGYGTVGAARNNSTGTITDAVGLYGDIINASAEGTITNAYNIKASTPYSNAGTIQNLYGVYIDSQAPTGGGTITNKWAFYQAGATDKSYFGGNVGIGSTTPYGLLSLHSASADNRPLFVVASTTPNLVATTTNFIITASGNVGIGTGSPNNKIQISNLLNFSDSTYSAYLGTLSGSSSTGNYNFGAGYWALKTNGVGTNNVAVGTFSMQRNTSGSYNTAVGYGAMQYNTEASNNTALGENAMYSNTTGGTNTAVGYNALFWNTIGTCNTAVGTNALASSTNSGQTGIGVMAAYKNTGAGNTVVGDESFYTNTTGSYNQIFGNSSFYDSASGDFNSVYGYDSGRGVTTGSSNTIIGSRVSGLASNLSNTVILADGTGDIRFYSDSSGNTGIGSTTPYGLLSLHSTSANNTPLFVVASTTPGIVATTTAFIIDSRGNVGIGTTTPGYALAVNGYIETKNGLITGDIRFANDFVLTEATTTAGEIASSPAAPRNDNGEEIWEAIVWKNQFGETLMVIDQGSRVGIATTSPTNILTIGQGRGSAIADNWEVYSSKEYKTDITYLEEQDYEDILEEIKDINVATYRWKDDNELDSRFRGNDTEESGNDNLNLGVIAEEAPQRILGKDGKSVSLYDYTSFALAGVKALQNEIEELKTLLNVVKDKEGKLTQKDPLIENSDQLARFGLAIDEDGYLTVDKLKAREIKTSFLEIDQFEYQHNGITFYDRINGQPYCFFVEGGVPSTVSGKCNDLPESEQNQSPQVPEDTPTEELDSRVKPENDTEGEPENDTEGEPENDTEGEPENDTEEGENDTEIELEPTPAEEPIEAIPVGEEESEEIEEAEEVIENSSSEIILENGGAGE